MNDNRNYNWDKNKYSTFEYSYIEKWIPKEAKVIDLACGNGSLLARLKSKKKIKEYGIEISQSGVAICKKKRLNVAQGRIDVELSDIKDNSFDYAICNVSIEMVMYPEITLREMSRIAKFQIISFPNFAFLPQRLDLLFQGKMPTKMLFGYNWYNTGHIHQLSIKDFKETIMNFNLEIKDSVYFGYRGLKKIIPNLFAWEAIFLLTKNN